MPRAGTTNGTGRLPAPVTAESLDRAALRYLNRFDASTDKLRRVLQAHVERAALVHATDLTRAMRLVEDLLSRYQGSGLLDDARYATALAEGLRRRGASHQAIVYKLRARGIAADVIARALGEAERDRSDAELEAARAFVRRRKLGPYRAPDAREAHYHKDLGALGRAGFSFDLAKRALVSSEDDEAL